MSFAPAVAPTMIDAIARWLGGDPWEVVPLHGAARWYVAMLGVASVLSAAALAIDQGSIIIVEGWQYADPIMLTIGGFACTVWAVRPTWRIAYAVGGSVLAASYLFRGVGALLTLATTTAPAPWALLLAYLVYTMFGLSILVVWRHLAPVIRPTRPPETPAGLH